MKAGRPSVPTSGCPENVVQLEDYEEPHPERLIGFALAIGAVTDQEADPRYWFLYSGSDRVCGYTESMLYQFLNA